MASNRLAEGGKVDGSMRVVAMAGVLTSVSRRFGRNPVRGKERCSTLAPPQRYG